MRLSCWFIAASHKRCRIFRSFFFFRSDWLARWLEAPDRSLTRAFSVGQFNVVFTRPISPTFGLFTPSLLPFPNMGAAPVFALGAPWLAKNPFLQNGFLHLLTSRSEPHQGGVVRRGLPFLLFSFTNPLLYSLRCWCSPEVVSQVCAPFFCKGTSSFFPDPPTPDFRIFSWADSLPFF